MAPKPWRGLGEAKLTPKAKGVGRGVVCVRVLEGSGETELAPEAKGSGEP